MATIKRFRGVSLLGLSALVIVFFGLSSYRSDKAVAAPALPEMSSFVLASDGGAETLSRYIPLNEFPKPPFSNWPAGCSGSGLKALPLLPKVPFKSRYIIQDQNLTDFIQDDRVNWGFAFNKNGGYRNTEGHCETNFADMGVQNVSSGSYRLAALTAMRDAGTCQPGIWEWDSTMYGSYPCITPSHVTFLGSGGSEGDKGVDNGGYSVNPDAYDGWAKKQTGFDYSAWKPAVKTVVNFDDFPDGTGQAAKDLKCLDYAGRNTKYSSLEGTGWVRERMQVETDIYEGSNLVAVAGNQCKVTKNFLSDMFPTEAANIRAGLDSLEDNGYNDSWGGNGLYSGGLTLYRREFSLSAEELDQIKTAQSVDITKGGLFIDMVADDYYTVYVNGCKIVSNVWNSAQISQIPIPYNYLHGPDNTCHNLDDDPMSPVLSLDPNQPNLLAIEVIDRIMTAANYQDSNATGLGLVVGIRDFDRYTLTTNSKCGAGSGASVDWTTTYVLAGGTVTCEHTVSKTGSSPPVISTTKRWVACKTYDSAGTLKSTGPSACELSLQVNTNLSTVSRTFTIPNDGTYQPGDKICTTFGYVPSIVSKLPSGVIKPATNPDGSLRSTESTPACITIADAAAFAPRPHSYFFGGDVFSASDIKFGMTSLYPRSRSQYAMLANGGITNPITANDYYVKPNSLVYANTGALGYLGVINDAKPIGTVGATVYSGSPINITTSPLATYGTTEFQSYAPSSGTLEINGVANVSSQITVRVDGSVKIIGNISLDNTGSYSLASLPNVTIIASGDITIDDSVTLVEATLIAGGSLKTCGNQPNNQSECNLPLKINGPTRAKDYYLYRTTTAATDTEASENFYFPPSAIMAPYARGSGSVVPTTEYETELPPRY